MGIAHDAPIQGLMRRALPLVLALVRAGTATVATTASASPVLNKTIHDAVVTALSPTSLSARVGYGSTLTCTFNVGGRLLISSWRIAVGMHVMLNCYSLDDGATWQFGVVLPEKTSRVSTTGIVTLVKGSQVEVTADSGYRLKCPFKTADAPKLNGVGVGMRVTLTCSFETGEYLLATLKPVPHAARVTQKTIAGQFFELSDQTLTIVRDAGAAGDTDAGMYGVDFAMDPGEYERLSALGFTYGDAIVVTARASGRQWVVVSVTRG